MINKLEKLQLSPSEKLEKIKNLLDKEDCDLLEVLDLKNNLSFPNQKEESKLNQAIWNKQFDLLFKNKIVLSSSSYPSMLLINHLLNQAYDYNVKEINKINYLESLREEGLKIIKEIKKSKNIDEIERIRKNSEDLNINLREYFIKRETKIKAAQIREESVDSSDISSAEKIIEKKSKKFRKKIEKENNIEILSLNENNKNRNNNNNNYIDLSNFENEKNNNSRNNNYVINTRSSDKKNGIGIQNSPGGHTIKLSDIDEDEDSMEVEEVIQIDDRKKRKKTQEVHLNENEDDEDNENDIIIEEIKEKNNEGENGAKNIDDNNIININNIDDEEINKILNKKTKRNNNNVSDFHIVKEPCYNTNKNYYDINKKKENTETKITKQKYIITKHNTEKKVEKFNTNKIVSHSNNISNFKGNKNEIIKKLDSKIGIESIDNNNRKKTLRKNALINITKLLNDNQDLKAQGEKFINNLAKKLEDDLAKAHPNIDYEYQKTLINMNKTLKEIAKYKNINQKIINQKCSLFKIAKFNYGEKFIQKLKKVNDGQKYNKDKLNKKNNFILTTGNLFQDTKNLIHNTSNSTFNVFKKEENKANTTQIKKNEIKDKYSPTKQIWNFSKEKKFSTTDIFKKENKLFETSEEQNKIKFSPTKNTTSTSTKLFNSNANIEEGEHIYEPLSKEKIFYKIFIPILFEPLAIDNKSSDKNNGYANDNNNKEKDKEIKPVINYKNTFIVEKPINNNLEKEEDNNNNINNISNINNTNNSTDNISNNFKDINTNNINNNDINNSIDNFSNNLKDINENNNNNNLINDKNNILNEIEINDYNKENKNNINKGNNTFNKNENNINISNLPPPKGSTLRIFHGKLRMNRIVLNNISLLSTNKYQKIAKFPNFEKELILPSKAKTTEVIPYCLKHLKNKLRILIYGWLEPDISNTSKNEEDLIINNFKNIINEFEMKNKCSCLISKIMKLYIFVINDDKNDFNTKIITSCNFTNNNLKEYLDKDKKYLVFTLISNTSDLNSDYMKFEEKIKPEIIKIKEKDDNIKDGYKSSSEEESKEKIEEEKNEKNNGSNDTKKNNNNDNNISDDMDDENKKLKELLSKEDFDVNTYAENNFKNLSLEEMNNKLLKLNEENRIKLMEFMQKYTETQKKAQIDDDMFEELEENINNDYNNNSIIPNMYMNNTMQINMGQNNQNIMNMNHIYINPIDPVNRNILQPQNTNMNINMNINNNLNNGSLLYYNQPMNIFNAYNQNLYKK